VPRRKDKIPRRKDPVISALENNLSNLKNRQKNLKRLLSKATSTEEKHRLTEVSGAVQNLQQECLKKIKAEKEKLKIYYAMGRSKRVNNKFNHYPRFVQGGTMSKK